MEIPWVTAILGIALIYILYWWMKKSMNHWKALGVPHIKPLPLIGNMSDVLTKKKSFVQVVNDMYSKFDGQKFYGMYLFTTPVLVIRDIELANQVLIKDFTHFTDRNLPSDDQLELITSSVANVTGDKWKVLRHKLTPTFSSGKMKTMFNKIKECSDEAVMYLKERKGQHIDSRDFLFKCMVNAIGDVSFGMKIDAFNEEKEKDNLFLKFSRKLFAPSLRTQISFLLFTAAPKLKKYLKLRIVDKEVNTFFHQLVKDLVKYRESSNQKRNDFLELMLNEKRKETDLISSSSNQTVAPDEEVEDLELTEHLKNVKHDPNFKVFTEDVIAAQTLIFVSAGTETSAATLSFALSELAQNADIQRRAQQEIDEILESEEFNYEALKKMTFLEAILNETMRLRPPGGVLIRLCTKDYQLPGTNIKMKKGDAVNIPVLGIHKDPQYFPDPEKFNPDRFKNMEEIPKGVFFPFGGGPRICIAMRLAMLKMKVFMATVLSTYNIVLSEKTKTPIKLDVKSLTQHVEGGIWLKFEPRNK